jgi:hypothetical protein
MKSILLFFIFQLATINSFSQNRFKIIGKDTIPLKIEVTETYITDSQSGITKIITDSVYEDSYHVIDYLNNEWVNEKKNNKNIGKHIYGSKIYKRVQNYSEEGCLEYPIKIYKKNKLFKIKFIRLENGNKILVDSNVVNQTASKQKRLLHNGIAFVDHSLGASIYTKKTMESKIKQTLDNNTPVKILNIDHSEEFIINGYNNVWIKVELFDNNQTKGFIPSYYLDILPKNEYNYHFAIGGIIHIGFTELKGVNRLCGSNFSTISGYKNDTLFIPLNSWEDFKKDLNFYVDNPTTSIKQSLVRKLAIDNGNRTFVLKNFSSDEYDQVQVASIDPKNYLGSVKGSTFSTKKAKYKSDKLHKYLLTQAPEEFHFLPGKMPKNWTVKNVVQQIIWSVKNDGGVEKFVVFRKG